MAAILTTRTWRKSRIASGCIGRDSVTSAAIARIYATTDPGPEREAALAKLMPATGGTRQPSTVTTASP